MAKVEVKLTMRVSPWVPPLLTVSAYICAIVSMVSDRAAEWCSERLTDFIAKHGFHIGVS